MTDNELLFRLEKDFQNQDVPISELIHEAEPVDRIPILNSLARAFLRRGWILAAAKCSEVIMQQMKDEDQCMRK